MSYKVSDTFVMSEFVENTTSLANGFYYYKSSAAGAYGLGNAASTTSFETTFEYNSIFRYAIADVVPVASTLVAWVVAGNKRNGSDIQGNVQVWKVPAPTNGDAGTTTTTLVQCFETTLDVDNNQIFYKSGTDNTEFDSGDGWFITMGPATASLANADHQVSVSLTFETR